MKALNQGHITTSVWNAGRRRGKRIRSRAEYEHGGVRFVEEFKIAEVYSEAWSIYASEQAGHYVDGFITGWDEENEIRGKS